MDSFLEDDVRSSNKSQVPLSIQIANSPVQQVSLKAEQYWDDQSIKNARKLQKELKQSLPRFREHTFPKKNRPLAVFFIAIECYGRFFQPLNDNLMKTNRAWLFCSGVAFWLLNKQIAKHRLTARIKKLFVELLIRFFLKGRNLQNIQARKTSDSGEALADSTRRAASFKKRIAQ